MAVRSACTPVHRHKNAFLRHASVGQSAAQHRPAIIREHVRHAAQHTLSICSCFRRFDRPTKRHARGATIHDTERHMALQGISQYASYNQRVYGACRHHVRQHQLMLQGYGTSTATNTRGSNLGQARSAIAGYYVSASSASTTALAAPMLFQLICSCQETACSGDAMPATTKSVSSNPWRQTQSQHQPRLAQQPPPQLQRLCPAPLVRLAVD